MKLTFLGTGTSQGVPVLGCQCRVCRSTDARDKRLRTSALIETDTTRILLDCGPDFRQQLLPLPFTKMDGVFLTHIHYDHVGGLDDLRPYCRLGAIDIYAQADVVEGLHHTMPYCFPKGGALYPGAPELKLHTIEAHVPVQVGDLEVVPIRVMHGKLPILGYRIGRLAYITDMKTISDAELSYLAGIEVLVVNGLRWEKAHHSHQLIADAMAFAQKLSAKETYLIHVTHEIGCYEEAVSKLPPHVHLAYDGQVIKI